MRTISKEVLAKAGYDEWKPNYFQKKLMDGRDVKYFINVQHYPPSYDNVGSMWDATIQCDTPKGSVMLSTLQWFNNDGKYSHNTIEDVEALFERFWQFLGQPRYEEYEK